MSQSPATRPSPNPRPLSPHLTVYRWPITMTMSILHRVTGGTLYVGALLVAWWLIAAATSERYFAFVDRIVGSWFGLLVLFGFTLALFVHMLGGVRHLIWDTGTGLEKHNASMLAWATLVGAVLLTIVVWAVFFMVG
ncbi:succinate dehydrogenase, cytochrome b556 subunit [Pseudaminobacter sp. 19-2017]|uniref:Succinate dehydrogenase cytochrome b556 subunit n=1 Tax=Pseudaminobacter soli (ex Zhang et al. 2022) TaxID=2831468 RepID=A0A942E3K9_9HYPH|nr:succinate dehydrogenase, cytochrome b556 subunit [Pseudaminobacter soli]MBS3647877.1 succinate dehydrogenase, cytochrome b556 subunit [Pseudaminobacter soli]